MPDDVVAELDRWLRVYDFAGLIDVAVVQRARDEIVALRKTLHTEHDEALEAAAQLAHANGFGETAAAIRALKDKPR